MDQSSQRVRCLRRPKHIVIGTSHQRMRTLREQPTRHQTIAFFQSQHRGGHRNGRWRSEVNHHTAQSLPNRQIV